MVNQLYDTWVNRILQLRPKERITRVQNMAWLIVGIYYSKSVHLSKIANQIPGSALLPSATRRIDRFLENAAVRVREWYEPVAQGIVDRAGHLPDSRWQQDRFWSSIAGRFIGLSSASHPVSLDMGQRQSWA